MNELLTMAREEGLEEITGLKKQDLIFKVLKERAKAEGVMYGEGFAIVLGCVFAAIGGHHLRDPARAWLTRRSHISAVDKLVAYTGRQP